MTAWFAAAAGLVQAQPRQNGPEGPGRVRPNYELAERFSQKKIDQMVHSTSVNPHWFKDSDKFWYEWEDTQGKHYYIVDAASGKDRKSVV